MLSRSPFVPVAALLGVLACGPRYSERLQPVCPPPRDSLYVVARPQDPLRVLGRVTDRDTGRPLAGVQVTAGRGRSTETDSAGGFRLDSLTSGRHTISFGRIGYEGRTEILEVSSRAGAQVRVPLVPQYVERCPTVDRVRVAKPWWRFW